MTNLCGYLTELAAVDASMLKYSYSTVSAAALYVALRTCGKPEAFPKALARHSGYSLEAVLPCAAALVKLMKAAPTNTLTAVFKKYSSTKLGEVAKMEPLMAIVEEVESELL